MFQISFIKTNKKQTYGYLSLLDYACQLKTTGMLS